MDESSLIARLQQGDREAYRSVVDGYSDLVYNTAIGIVQQEGDAEDVTQEVFIAVFESIGEFKSESKLSTWLYRIAVTKSLDLLRKKKRKKRSGIMQNLFGQSHEELPETGKFYHPGVRLENRQRAEVLFKAIAQLPENQKVAFTLHKLEGLSYQEIAEVMETSISSVESLMHRAKHNLRKHLADYYEKDKD